MTIDLSYSELMMAQHLNDKNSPIGVGMYVTDKFRFFAEGERHFTTFCYAPEIQTVWRLVYPLRPRPTPTPVQITDCR